MNEILEYKSLTGELKDLDLKKRIVTGYLSSFGNKDLEDDIVIKGAFNKSLNERKGNIFFLNQHNWKQPHSRFNTLTEDAKGLYFESDPLADTSYSNDTLKLYEAGVIKEHSIGYSTIKSHNKGGARHLTELKLYEGSNVTLGANPNTPFTGLKNATIKEINDQSKLIYKAIRNGTFTDDTFNLLELALKQLQMEAFILGKNTLKEPFKDTLKFEPLSALEKFNNNF